MRALVLTSFLLVSLLAVPFASAQGAATATVLDDATGDVAGPLPAAAAPFVDLTRAEVGADEADLAFRVTVADLPPTSDAGLQWELWLHFTYRDTPFDLTIFGQPPKTLPDDAHREIWGELTAVLYLLDAEEFGFPTEALRTSAESGLSAITIPPASLIRRAPSVPSLPVPDRMTATASSRSPASDPSS